LLEDVVLGRERAATAPDEVAARSDTDPDLPEASDTGTVEAVA
jgi:hypothetical protein